MKTIFAITRTNKVSSVPLEEIKRQNRGGVGRKVFKCDGDWLATAFIANPDDSVLFITRRGRVFYKETFNIDTNLAKTNEGDSIAKALVINKSMKSSTSFYCIAITRNNHVLRVPLKALLKSNTCTQLITLNDNDALVDACISEEGEDFFCASNDGFVIRFSTDLLKTHNAGGLGVKCFAPTYYSNPVACTTCKFERHMFVLGNHMYGSFTNTEDYRKTARGARGVRCMDIFKDELTTITSCNREDDIILVNTSGRVMRIICYQIRETSRCSTGVRLFTDKDNGYIVAAIAIESPESDIDD